MELDSLHILLTYICNFECDHCFTWGSPWQTGVFTRKDLLDTLEQAAGTGTIKEIYFEGGEAFLYYPLLLEGVRQASRLGFSTGIVSNGFWATTEEDARLWLEPLAGVGLHAIEISNDRFHTESEYGPATDYVQAVAEELGLTSGVITIEHSGESRDRTLWKPGLPLIGGGVMFRGRAAEALTPDLPRQPWDAFPTCPYENLESPSRLHLDPFGNLHLCQGLVIGNMFQEPLKDILKNYDPRSNPLLNSLIAGGPSLLIKRYLNDRITGYVDACHACYSVRLALCESMPEELVPDQMYGKY